MDSTQARTDARHDDLRDLLSMLAVLIGSRIERDAIEWMAEDREADALLASVKGQLAALFLKREEDQARPRFLAWAENLATVYEAAPEDRRDAAWPSYEDRVRSALYPSGSFNHRKLASCFFTREQVRRLRGPVEAGRIAAARLADRTEGTLRNWRKRGVQPSDETSLPFEEVSFYGVDVHYPDAVADVVSLLSVEGVDADGYVGALRSVPSPEEAGRLFRDALQAQDDDDA